MSMLTATTPQVIRSFSRTLTPVREARRTPKAPGRFGVGILAARPTYTAPITTADEAWYIEQFAASEDRHYDAMEADAIGLARVDMGLCF
ncbi:hypothetical protein [Singulisphaera acidiphila]|uniref:Uncharacterized protein n=1 Tax=Singulisphaera acidiphila (strain ATCC BAA-1392 / DSM 18658 / VKM B-2454 / MOB10) TaxID=886293 RepID=L0DQD8_SINAD|nr:hypothetical protein [Singulisphaera acidiphila]AGA31639.1 hypothetical protein Sinac_7608 [Singulisphaera acidiphila DSM 18658]